MTNLFPDIFWLINNQILLKYDISINYFLLLAWQNMSDK